MVQHPSVDHSSADASKGTRSVREWHRRVPLLLLLVLACAAFATACQELDTKVTSGGLRQPDGGGADAGCALPFSLDPTGEIICGDPVTGTPPVVTKTPPIQTATGVTQDPCVQTSQQALQIRQRTCAGCHAAPAAMGAFAFVLDDKMLVAARSSNPQVMDATGQRQRLVIPGDPDNSRLYQRVVHSALSPSGQMPPLITDPTLPANPRPSVSEISLLRTWIKTCLAAGSAGGA